MTISSSEAEPAPKPQNASSDACTLYLDLMERCVAPGATVEERKEYRQSMEESFVAPIPAERRDEVCSRALEGLKTHPDCQATR